MAYDLSMCGRDERRVDIPIKSNMFFALFLALLSTRRGFVSPSLLVFCVLS
jgi:hypothetical protein